MNALEIIVAKRDGEELSTEQIQQFVRGVTSGEVPDYQTAAWLMALFLRGATTAETRALTFALRDSGRVLDLSGVRGGPVVDKHSTGGVGDKTSLVVVPIVAAAGVPVFKMSGRGLGFSGGTVDKLESIPGFRASLSVPDALGQLNRIGAVLMAQTADLAPADGLLYSLRDVTGTVESLPLIASSIMAKKLAGGSSKIVVDVKVGRGAFMKTAGTAAELAAAMIDIGAAAGVSVSATLTRMDEPLGFAVGNSLEVTEALDVLEDRPNVCQSFRALCLHFAAELLHGRVPDPAQCAADMLTSGAAAAKFARIVGAQGGPTDIGKIRAGLQPSPDVREIHAARSGVVTTVDAAEVGRLSVEMGAGRRRKGDDIDHSVGLVFHVKTGDPVRAGDLLATLYLRSSDSARFDSFCETAAAAIEIGTRRMGPVESLIISSLPSEP